MTIRHDAYSTLVAGLKVLLPLAALGILSTLFLMSSPRDPKGALSGPAERIVADGRIGRPEYTGVDARGAAITLIADAATPDPNDPDRVATDGLTGTIETPGGARLQVSAPRGSVDGAARTVRLTGGVRLTTSTGYVVNSDSMSAALDAVALTANAVAGEGPAGTLRAGTMEVSDEGGQYMMRFGGGVTMLYRPVTSPGANE